MVSTDPHRQQRTFITLLRTPGQSGDFLITSLSACTNAPVLFPWCPPQPEPDLGLLIDLQQNYGETAVSHQCKPCGAQGS